MSARVQRHEQAGAEILTLCYVVTYFESMSYLISVSFARQKNYASDAAILDYFALHTVDI